MTKKFGRKSTAKAPRHDFDVTFLRDEMEEVHTFLAIEKTDAIGLSKVLIGVNNNAEAALPEMLGLIRRHLDNTDGVPSTWQPTPLPTRETREFVERAAHDLGLEPAWPAETGQLEEADAEPEVRKFRAPDGTLHPMSDAPKFLEHSAGSSRRRWLELMADEELEIDLEQLTDMFEWIISLAAKRPTGPSA